MGETTNDLQQSLVDTMDLISSKIARGTGAPHTIKAEIIEELDSGVHQYSISYGGAVYKDAYAIGNVTYDPSTIVYVLIPENDFDNEKVILNAVVPSASDYEDEELTELKVPINDDLLAQFNISLDLQSWTDQEYPVINLTSAKGDNTFNKTFKDYSNTYKMFTFEASVKTEIDEDHRTKGNYGLKLTLPFVQRDESNSTGRKKITKDFYMDVTNLLGNPYEYNIYQKTILYFTIDEALEYDVDEVATITPFTKDFGYITNPKGIESDIHFRNVGIRMIDVVPIEQIKGHYLTIESDHGYYFLETESTSYKEPKTLTPVLRINGKKTNYSSYDCYWFVEDASINALSKEYTTLGGSSWRCLNQKVNVTTDDTGKQTFEYKTNDYQLVINPDDVVSSLRYKCILVKQQYSASSIVTIKNLNDPILFSLESKTGSNTYVEKVGNVELRAKLIDPNESDIKTKSYSVSWQRYDKDGVLKSEDFYTLDNEETIYPYNTETKPNYHDTEYYQDISFPCGLIEKSNTIYCTFYMDYTIEKINEAGEKVIEFIHKMIGTVSLFINTISGLKYAVSIVGGDKLYKYDSQGNSPMVANYDGAPTSEGKACDPLKFRVYRTEDGKELTESEYLYTTYKWTFPKKNTMLELVKPAEGSTNPVLTEDDDYYYIEGRQGNGYNLQYKIRSTYRQSYTNNIIRLSVTINGEDAGTDATTITFTKDGMGGTNGSRYTAFIINNNHAYNEIDEDTGELRKAQVIYAANPSGDYLAGWYKYEVGEQKKPQPMGTNNGIPFQLKLYRDSTPIESLSSVKGPNVSISVEWSMFDPWETHTFFQMDRGDNDLSAIMNVREMPANPDAPDAKNIWINTWSNSDDKICNIVQAVVTITDPTIIINDEDKSLMEEVLYVYYPIEAIRAENAGMIFNGIIPTLKGGFSEVLYDSGGTNPIWDESNKNIYCIDSVYQDNKVDLHYNWEVSSNLKVDNKNKTYNNTITPITKFEHNITNNYVEVDLVLTPTKKEELKTKKDNLEDNKNTLNQELTKLKNFKQSLLDMIQNIGYNRYINIDSKECLKGCINLLKIRFQLLTTLDSLKLKLNDLRLLENTLRIELKNAGKPITSSPIDSDSLLTKINTTYRHIYLLDGNTNKIEEDVDFTIRIPNASSYYNSFIYGWNDLATKYRNIINNNYLVWVRNKPNEVNAQYNNLNDLRISITNLVPYCFDIKENLDSAHQGILAYTTDQQFINLKQQVSNLTNKVTDVENGGICSYTDFEKLLADLTSLVSKYNTNAIFEDPDEKILESTDYTRNICDKAIDENESALADITSEMDSITINLETGPSLIYLKPIIMHMNNTGMSYLRGWDGHKLYKGAHGKDGSGDEYFYAPEIGAGVMENGLFTGMLMAAMTSNGSTSKPNIGLFGMNKSIQTMFLNAQDGSAIFGASGSGQVIIDPSSGKGLIYSANYFDKEVIKDGKKEWEIGDFGPDGKPLNLDLVVGHGKNGLLINLTDAYIHFGNVNKGKIYSGGHNRLDSSEDGFYLDHEGLSIGSTIRISSDINNTIGKVEVGYLKSGDNHWTIQGAQDGTYSYIGYKANAKNFSTDTDGIISIDKEQAKESSVYIGTDGIRLGRGFAVDNEGNGFLSGHIEATSGDIGRWKIAAKKLEGKNVSTGEKETKYNKGDLVGIPKEGDYINNTFARLDPDGDITVMNTGIYGTWKLGHDGIVKVDSAGSIFGGVHITDSEDPGNIKETYYTSQHFKNLKKNGVFHENCFDEIQLISQNEINSLEGRIISVVDDSGAATSYHIVVPKFFEIPAEYYK